MATITIKALEAATKPRADEWKFTVEKNLYVRVAPDGARTWLVRYVIDGKQKQARLPKPYGAGPGCMSLAEAVSENQRIQSLARAGVDFQQQAIDAIEKARAEAAERRAAAERDRAALLPFREMFDAWLQDGVRRKDGNAELRRSFDKDVLPAIGDKPVKHITEHDLRALLASIVERGRNRMTVRVYRDLVQLFAWAEKRQPWRALLVEQNPAELVEIAKIVSPDYDLNDERERVLSAAEIRELRDIFKRMGDSRREADDKRATEHGLMTESQIAVWLCLSTLCRIGELLQAEWAHIDLKAGVWHIPKANTKKTAGKQQDHTVYLSPFAIHQFKSLQMIRKKDSKWCFPARNAKAGDTHVCVKSVSKQIGDRQMMFKKRKALKNRRNDDTLVLAKGKAGEWTPHDLRRTGATMMQKAGIGLDVIDRCQNHVLAGSKVRRAYLHHDYAAEKRAAWDVLGRGIEAVLRTVEQ